MYVIKQVRMLIRIYSEIRNSPFSGAFTHSHSPSVEILVINTTKKCLRTCQYVYVRFFLHVFTYKSGTLLYLLLPTLKK